MNISLDEEKESLPYLTSEEQKEARMLLNEMDDFMAALKMEVNTREKSYKSYLIEKLNNMITDINYLASIITK